MYDSMSPEGSLISVFCKRWLEGFDVTSSPGLTWVAFNLATGPIRTEEMADRDNFKYPIGKDPRGFIIYFECINNLFVGIRDVNSPGRLNTVFGPMVLPKIVQNKQKIFKFC